MVTKAKLHRRRRETCFVVNTQSGPRTSSTCVDTATLQPARVTVPLPSTKRKHKRRSRNWLKSGVWKVSKRPASKTSRVPSVRCGFTKLTTVGFTEQPRQKRCVRPCWAPSSVFGTSSSSTRVRTPNWLRTPVGWPRRTESCSHTSQVGPFPTQTFPRGP